MLAAVAGVRRRRRGGSDRGGDRRAGVSGRGRDAAQGLPAARSSRSGSATTPRRQSCVAPPRSTRQGKRRQAAAIFSRYDSLEAKLGAAFAAWPASEDRIEQLGALYPRSSLVQLHVGLSRFWAGPAGALTAWREARDVEPDTPYAVRADDLIHPEFAPGLPGFIVSFDYRVEGETPADAARSGSRPTGRCAGACSTGSRCRGSAGPSRRAAPSPRRCALAPNDVDALVADAVGRYDKGNPSASFSRLGPLSRRFPHAATVRFHLGLLLLWQRNLEEATRQLELARKAEPGGKIAGEAKRFLDAVRNAGTA